MQVNQVRKTEKWGENQKNWTQFELAGSSSSLSSSCQGSTVQCIHISIFKNYIPQAQMGSVLTQRPRGQEEYYCFSKIQLVGQNKTTLAIQPPLFWFSKPVLFSNSLL